MMLVKKLFPPNYAAIKAAFNPPLNVVFTYGNIIYAPYIDFDLPHDLIVHETVHKDQQKDNPELWWDKYILDPSWRFHQELQAYRAQYKAYLQNHNREEAFKFLLAIASDLSGPIYGNLREVNQCMRLIKNR